MDILNQLITLLSREESRHYKLYLSRTERSTERKDVTLFDYIRKSGESYNEEQILKQLYGDGDKNAFYRMRNRMITDISRAQLALHFQHDDNIKTLQYIALARLYSQKNAPNIAYYFTRKAEKKALEMEDYELLDVIYGLFINLSHEIVTINPETYINKRKDNYSRFAMFRDVDDLLASLNYHLKISQNYAQINTEKLKMLESTITALAQHENVRTSSRLQLKIYHAYSRLLLQLRDYTKLQHYSIEMYEQFNGQRLFVKNNHEDKLQMLVYIINSLFKNGDYTRSLEYSQILGKAIEDYDKMYYEKYLFFYYNSLVINYSQLDVDKAIEILEQLKDNDLLRKQYFYQVFIYLNLTVSYFDKKQYRKAMRELTRLYIHDSYKDMDPTLKFKIAFAELILRYELKDNELLEKRLERFRKEHAEQLTKNYRENEILKLLSKMVNIYDIQKHPTIRAEIQAFLAQPVSQEIQDSEVIKYNQWLQNYQ